MPDRYVILHHRLDGGEHWDLMLEQGGILWTWQLFRDPTDRANLPIPARRIADHRLAYLDYEGPISGDRGTVRRIDAGEYSVDRSDAESLIVRLKGSALDGVFRIAPIAAGCDAVFDESL